MHTFKQRPLAEYLSVPHAPYERDRRFVLIQVKCLNSGYYGAERRIVKTTGSDAHGSIIGKALGSRASGVLESIQRDQLCVIINRTHDCPPMVVMKLLTSYVKTLAVKGTLYDNPQEAFR